MDRAQIDFCNISDQGLERNKANTSRHLTQVVNSIYNPAVLDTCTKPDIRERIRCYLIENFGHSLRALGENLIVMLGCAKHHIPNTPNKGLRDVWME